MRIRFAFKKDEPYTRLKKILGFAPKNIELYKLAMRHRSSLQGNQPDKLYNNERLEFLGDTVLNTIISDILYKNHPKLREGELTTMRSKMVQRATLDHLAVTIGLKPLIQSNAKLLKSDEGHITGNAFEALIGAIYLDRGYRVCKKFIERLITSKVLDMEQIIKNDTNYKSRLIEWTQRRKVEYHFTHTTENLPNSKCLSHFTANVYVETFLVGTGKGRNKKEAEQKACKAALHQIKRKEFKAKLNEAKPDISTQKADISSN